ncbi:hypothetical protein E3N88_37339 [Mikania micrantha]|uniref:PB1-like domain-containing protein n=1 Tax=Mikania micrantha TaxID=192012 RepID=A0A5N6LT24_9ASTR|nr:hypothetical protein E3N88_37339 [Mikania micrantha]
MTEMNIKLWYGGAIHAVHPRFNYVGGESKLISNDIDKLSFFELVDYVMETGQYKSKKFHMYWLNTVHIVMKKLVSDKEVSEMAGKVHLWPFVDVFVHQGPLPEPVFQEVQPSPSTIGPEHKLTTPLAQAHSEAQPCSLPVCHMTKSAARRLPTPPTIASDKVCGSPSSPFKVFTKSTARRLTISPTDKDGSDLEGDSDSEDNTYEVEGSRFGSDDDETEEVSTYGSDKDDDEFVESLKAVKKVTEEDSRSRKILVEECLKGNREAEIIEGDVGGYSSYEESDGDVLSPGESEDDDIRGKKYTPHVPNVDEQTDCTSCASSTSNQVKSIASKTVTLPIGRVNSQVKEEETWNVKRKGHGSRA